MPVVTITGTMGSGCKEIGRAAASLLEIDYVDHQLILDAARRLGVPVDMMADHDERCPGFGQRLAGVLRTFLERSAAAGDPITGAGGIEMVLGRSYEEMAHREEPEVSDSLYMKTMTALITELGERGDIVILGRGGQMILRGLPGAVHVLTLAPHDLRVERIARREALSPEDAERRVHSNDRHRAAFYKRYWKVDVDDPSLYDLSLETSRMGYEAGAELVASAARIRAAAAV